jgi:hypothetical protein
VLLGVNPQGLFRKLPKFRCDLVAINITLSAPVFLLAVSLFVAITRSTQISTHSHVARPLTERRVFPPSLSAIAELIRVPFGYHLARQAVDLAFARGTTNSIR